MHFFRIPSETWTPPPITEVIILSMLGALHLQKGDNNLIHSPATLTADDIKSSTRGYAPRTLDWGDMMTYSLYLGRKPK